MQDWEVKALEHLSKIIEDNSNAVVGSRQIIDGMQSKLAEIEKREGITRAVGDPHNRPSLDPYRVHLVLLGIRFRKARNAAWEDLTRAGSWRNIPRYLLQCKKGYVAFFWLSAAAWLYRLRISHVIDVRRHEAVLRGIFPQTVLASA